MGDSGGRSLYRLQVLMVTGNGEAYPVFDIRPQMLSRHCRCLWKRFARHPGQTTQKASPNSNCWNSGAIPGGAAILASKQSAAFRERHRGLPK